MQPSQVCSTLGGPAEGAAGSAAGGADTIEVRIVSLTFRPRLVVINAGARVGWTNHDEIPHALRFGRARINSPVLLRDDHFSHRFTEPGTYDYTCAVEPSMRGIIVVTG